MPEWWRIAEDDTNCGDGRIQHIVGAIIDVQCRGEYTSHVVTVSHTYIKVGVYHFRNCLLVNHKMR